MRIYHMYVRYILIDKYWGDDYDGIHYMLKYRKSVLFFMLKRKMKVLHQPTDMYWRLVGEPTYYINMCIG